MPTCGIYAIVHRASGRTYVGQSVNIERRWLDHRRAIGAASYPSDCTGSTEAMWMDCHGPVDDEFEFKVLEETQHLDEAEARWERIYRERGIELYNTAPCGWSVRPRGKAGYRLSPEARERLRATAPNKRAVVNLDSGEVFVSGYEAAREHGLKLSISAAIRKVCRSAGHRWAYVGDEEAQAARYAEKERPKPKAAPKLTAGQRRFLQVQRLKKALRA